jgi:hypothetical protein
MKYKKFQLILLFCLISSALAIATIRANSYVHESKDFIEVCSKGVAYVPFDTKFVKCNGIIRKVMGFARFLTDAVADCECPKCCDGSCWITIYDGNSYWFLWLAC